MEESLVMEEVPRIPPAPEPLSSAPSDPADAWRVPLLRRLRLLMLAGVSAFILTTWALVRVEDPLSLLPGGSGPSHVVRRHFEALNRGEVRTAYDFFSSQYRAQIPFHHYRRLVADHNEMFRTREIEFRAPASDGDRAVLDARVYSSNGRQYQVQFKLVHTSGRWWIDAVRWSAAPDPESFSYT